MTSAQDILKIVDSLFRLKIAQNKVNFKNIEQYDEFFVKNRMHIEYIAIRTILISFLHDVWVRTAHNKKTFNNAVEYASKWLKTYIPNWSKNEILTSISNNDSRKIIQYLKTFIFKPKNIIKSFSSLEKEI